MLRDSWDNAGRKSISKRMFDKVKNEEPLTKRIAGAQREFDIQIAKLDVTRGKMQKIHDTIFQKVMHAQRRNQIRYARAYAQELGQVRKMLAMVNGAKLSLEQVKIRLDTVTEFGDVVVTLSPCMSLIRGLAPSLSGIMPQASSSMNDLSEMLGDVIDGSSMGAMGTGVEVGAGSEEARAILEEAHNVMVGKAQTAFPDVPAEFQSGKAGVAAAATASDMLQSVPNIEMDAAEGPNILPPQPQLQQPPRQQQPAQFNVPQQQPAPRAAAEQQSKKKEILPT
ncbi:MAG: Snf7 family protein [Thaumarchaeota archaeon]|nr:Snf7 family protein [Nitrososphaerota archaeon]